MSREYNIKIKDPKFLPHIGCEFESVMTSSSASIIVGENGLGKTTLLSRIYAECSYKKVLVEQKGMDLFFDRSLGQTKKIFLETCGQQLEMEAFNSLWLGFGLNAKEERRLSKLSGGEGQAFKICCALSQRVEFYFLDEPSHFLDTQRKKVLKDYLEALRKDGRGLLIVEHDLSWIPSRWEVHELGVNDGQLREVNSWIT